MALSQAQIAFRDALVAARWEVVSIADERPCPLVIRRGKATRRLLVYAWNITSEGQGRSKAGRTDLDWRVQTTRPHEGDLQSPPGMHTAGLGWRAEQQVFGGFDVWVKRTTGVSSSVHFTRKLLDEAEQAGWATELREDGPECAFRPERVDDFLDWLSERHQPQDTSVYPVSYEVADDRLRVTADRRNWRTLALRPSNKLVLRGEHGALLDKRVWQVDTITTDRQQSEAGSNKAYLDIECHAYGIVRQDANLLKEHS